MSQKQHDSDPCTNANQSPWSKENALALARARADAVAIAAFHHSSPRPALRSDVVYKDTSSPLSNRNCRLSTCGTINDNFNGDSDATAFAVNVNNL